MDFIPVSPLPLIDQNVIETIEGLTSSVKSLTKQVNEFNEKEKALVKRVSELEKQNRELVAQLHAVTGKRPQAATSLIAAPSSKRAVSTIPSKQDNVQNFFEKTVYPLISQYGKAYYVLHPSDKPGIYISYPPKPEDALIPLRKQITEEIVSLSKQEASLKRELEHTGEFIDVLLEKSECLSIIAHNVVKDHTGALYSIPDKIISYILFYAGRKDCQVRCLAAMTHFVQPNFVIELVRSKLIFKFETALDLAKANLCRTSSKSPALQVFLRSNPSVAIGIPSPGRVEKSYDNPSVPKKSTEVNPDLLFKIHVLPVLESFAKKYKTLKEISPGVFLPKAMETNCSEMSELMACKNLVVQSLSEYTQSIQRMTPTLCAYKQDMQHTISFIEDLIDPRTPSELPVNFLVRGANNQLYSVPDKVMSFTLRYYAKNVDKLFFPRIPDLFAVEDSIVQFRSNHLFLKYHEAIAFVSKGYLKKLNEHYVKQLLEKKTVIINEQILPGKIVFSEEELHLSDQEQPPVHDEVLPDSLASLQDDLRKELFDDLPEIIVETQETEFSLTPVIEEGAS